MIFRERRGALKTIHGGEIPYGEFLDAGGPFQATAKLIWEWFFFISRPLAREDCETRAVTLRNNS